MNKRTRGGRRALLGLADGPARAEAALLVLLTPSVDLVATILTGLSWNFWSFALFRLAIAAGIGGALGVMISVLRRYLPESPRWLMTHGRGAKAAEIVGEIEERMARHGGTLPPLAHAPIRLVAHDGGWFAATFRLLLGFVLMASQIFYYNVIFFTYLIILTQFYHVPAGAVGWFLLPFAAGNFLGPLLLGRLFDTLGRRTMIGGTYALGAALMLVAAGFMLWLGVAAAGGGGAAAFRGGAAGMSGLV